MQLLCEGLDLSDAVLKVSKAISSKTTNPILEGIKLVADDGTLTISATDLELAIEKKIKADIKDEGEIVVPGKFFCEFIKKLTNERINLSTTETNMLKIGYGDSEGYVQCLNFDEYPSIKKIDSNEYFGITQKDLKSLINKSIFSVATDDSRPILKGCLLEIIDQEIKAVALDGYRLALVKKPLINNTCKTSIIVPARSLSEISKMLEDCDDIVNFYVQKNHVMIDLNNTKIITRTIDGDFLNYKQIIAEDFTTNVSVNVEQIKNALERASLLSKVGQNNLVKFDIKEKNMIVTSNSEIGNIKENVSIVLSGKDLNIAFNAMYFMEALRVNNNEFIKIGFNSAVNPCVITPIDNDEFLYLILPVRMIN